MMVHRSVAGTLALALVTLGFVGCGTATSTTTTTTTTTATSARITAAAGTEEAPGDALEQAQAEFFDAMASRDAERITGLFADDGVLHIAGRPPVRGAAAIGEFYGNLFRFLQASSAQPETVRVAGAGDMAYSVGRTTNRFPGADGPEELAGKYAMIWRRIDGRWRVVLYAISSD